MRQLRVLLRNADVWGGLFWLALGVFVTIMGLRLKLGALSEPGSGFMVFWMGVMITGLAAIVVVQAIGGGGRDLGSLWREARWPRVLLVIVALAVYASFFERAGFLLCTMILLVVLLRSVERIAWRIVLPFSLVVTVGVWAAMTKWLKISLPSGSWFN